MHMQLVFTSFTSFVLPLLNFLISVFMLDEDPFMSPFSNFIRFNRPSSAHQLKTRNRSGRFFGEKLET